jgi:hypothetical protein
MCLEMGHKLPWTHLTNDISFLALYASFNGMYTKYSIMTIFRWQFLLWSQLFYVYKGIVRVLKWNIITLQFKHIMHTYFSSIFIPENICERVWRVHYVGCICGFDVFYAGLAYQYVLYILQPTYLCLY